MEKPVNCGWCGQILMQSVHAECSTLWCQNPKCSKFTFPFYFPHQKITADMAEMYPSIWAAVRRTVEAL